MSLVKLLGSVGAVALGALVAFGPANAAPVPIVPGGTFVLAGGNDYAYTQPTSVGFTGGTDTFNFAYLGNFSSASNDTSVNPKFSLGNPNSFTSLTVAWLLNSSVLASHAFGEGEFGFTLPLPLSGISNLYQLIITWAKPSTSTAVYDTVIQTSEPLVTQPTPLPPAAVLFVSALAGLGLLGRRRVAKVRTLAS